MSQIDQLLILFLILMAALIAVGSQKLKHDAYSRLLIGIIISSVLVISLFQIYDVGLEAATATHSAISAITQLAIYGLASKLWLKLNYPDFTKMQQRIVHVLAHGGLALFALFSFWLKNNYPLALILLYPLSGISISLLEESIERGFKHNAR